MIYPIDNKQLCMQNKTKQEEKNKLANLIKSHKGHGQQLASKR